MSTFLTYKVYNVFTMKSKELVLVALFATLTSIGAFIAIPFVPVPITLQTFFVMLSGMLLGKRLGALSQLFYLFLGAIGLPVFSGGGSGIGFMAGPTGGYLIGFVLGAYAVGLVTEKRNDIRSYVVGLILCTIVIDVCGVLQLMNFTGMSFVHALEVGVLPFLVGDILKSALAISITRKVKLANVLHLSHTVYTKS